MDEVLKIYDRVVIDMDTGAELESDAHEWRGDVALCKGGGGSTTVVQEADKEYNARLAAVQERMQDIADEYFKFWQDNNAKLEAAKIQAELENVPAQQRITQGLLGMQKAALPQTRELSQRFLDANLNGVNAEEWANRAGTDQQIAASNANAQLARNAARMGLNPNSGNFTRALTDQATQNAANVAAARTQAFRAADQENYQRLANGMNAGLGLINPQ